MAASRKTGRVKKIYHGSRGAWERRAINSGLHGPGFEGFGPSEEESFLRKDGGQPTKKVSLDGISKSLRRPKRGVSPSECRFPCEKEIWKGS